LKEIVNARLKKTGMSSGEKVASSGKTPFHQVGQPMARKKKIKAIFFDAVGTLFCLTKTVGDHYALVANEIGLALDPGDLDRAFLNAWRGMPRRVPIDGPRENDDKDWWHQLVDLVLDQVAPWLGELDRDNFFEIAYEHFAERGVWELYPEVTEVLTSLQPRFPLGVISNFDSRLRVILEYLGVSKFFRQVFISSELGADKPDPEIFRRAIKMTSFPPTDVLHVGDDPERDWKAASAAGLSIFRLDRRQNSLRDLVAFLKL
jgi:putative hydrolase of the HAD superfamily